MKRVHKIDMETQLPRTKKKKKGTSDKTALKNIFS